MSTCDFIADSYDFFPLFTAKLCFSDMVMKHLGQHFQLSFAVKE